MNAFEQKLIDFIHDQQIEAEHIHYDQSCHTVQEAADAAGTSPSDLVKNICLIDQTENLIVAIVSGDDRVSLSRVSQALQIEQARIAAADEILQKTGYPCGGVPSFGYQATFLVDPKVMDKEIVYTGGGSANSLVRLKSQELLKINLGMVTRIRK
ncbi:MAG: hypothetical protein GXY22_05775 [Clostridiaceae bacterium]|nr:hypothetical protein [Clostridiaceae bacterium]